MVSKKLLLELIAECDGHNEYSFHKAVLQGMKGRLKLHAYVFSAVCRADHVSWRITTDRSMELLSGASARRNCFCRSARSARRTAAIASTYYGAESRCVNSLVSDGCIIEGDVEEQHYFPRRACGEGREDPRLHPDAGHGGARRRDV